jgi:hypothetical protein
VLQVQVHPILAHAAERLEDDRLRGELLPFPLGLVPPAWPAETVERAVPARRQGRESEGLLLLDLLLERHERARPGELEAHVDRVAQQLLAEIHHLAGLVEDGPRLIDLPLERGRDHALALQLALRGLGLGREPLGLGSGSTSPRCARARA